MNQTTGSLSRREFVKLLAASLPAMSTLAATAHESEEDHGGVRKQRPNIVLFIADQFRLDFVGAYGLNCMEVGKFCTKRPPAKKLVGWVVAEFGGGESRYG